MNIDSNIIESCIQQQRVAQNKMYSMLLPYLRAIANRYLKDTSYAKDVLQEGFVKIFKNIHKYDSNKAPIKQWAARIIINTALNYNDRVITNSTENYKSCKPNLQSIPKAIEKMSNDHLLFVLKQMPDNYFKVFNLYAIDGYSHEEIGVLLKISQELSRKRLSRSRTWIKKTFEQNPEWKDAIKVLPINLKKA